VKFHENGTCREGVLLQAGTYNVGTGTRSRPIRFQKGKKIEFYENGTVHCGTLVKDEQVYLNGVMEVITWDDCDACFYESGELAAMSVEDRQRYETWKPEYQYRGNPIANYTHLYTMPMRLLFSHYRKGIVDAFQLVVSNNLERAYINSLGADIIMKEAPLNVLVRFTDADMTKIESLIFERETEIAVKGKKITCPARQWVTLE
jgi:hypothetical protein